MRYKILLILSCFTLIYCQTPAPIVETMQKARYNNPGMVKDRKPEIDRPPLHNNFNSRFKAKFHPNWMDYCDPWHCNDYHKPACGLNRKNMKFKWFQSGCHIVLNNLCHVYLGTLKYDIIDAKHCTIYVMHLRMGCQMVCDEEEEEADPVCAVSSVDNHVVLFKNKCAFEKVNCRSESLQEYDEADMSTCRYFLDK